MKKEKNSKLANNIAQWIRTQVKNARANGVVLGLSGGIDSAVVAVLCKKAMGDKMLGVIMPCMSNMQDETDARDLAQKFDIQTQTIRLDPAFRELRKLLPWAGEIAVANIKPRLRMTTLYCFANNLNYLVAGTGNKSELMVGYFTKYGDGGADILPIGDLYKTEVRNLAADLRVTKRIMEKPASAGLWQGQTDEGELGLSYDDLDESLQVLEKDKAAKADRTKSVVLRRVGQLVSRSAHKRDVVPTFIYDRGHRDR